MKILITFVLNLYIFLENIYLCIRYNIMIKSVLRISNLDFYELHIISEKVNKTVGNSRSLRIDSNLKANLDRKIY